MLAFVYILATNKSLCSYNALQGETITKNKGPDAMAELNDLKHDEAWGLQ